MKCQNCSHENPNDARFCLECGQKLERSCPSCGTSNPADARFCKQCGTPFAGSPNRLDALRQSAPQSLRDKIILASANVEGERKPVTILFTDIVGSTSYAEKMDPEEWKEIVSGAHERVSQAVYRYEGTIAQLLGDGVLAFFGAPITHEDDPLRAVRAALDIQHAIEAYSRQLEGYIEHFQMRIGINTGTVIVGAVGSDLHMEYLAIGDAVNLAARLQSAARPGHVLISEATGRMVKAAFELEALGEMAVKGKAAPVKVFEVIEPKEMPSSGRGIEGLFSPLVGRDQELSVLRSALDRLASGYGQIVTILGEAGIGKSRLVEEARNSPSGASFRWLEGRALSYGQAISFWSLTQLIKNDLGLSDADPETRIKVALRKRSSTLCPDCAAEVLPYLAHLLGVHLEDESARRIQQLDGETLKRQTLWAIGEYFAGLAEEQPTVLVFEDLHWADPSTLDALGKLLALSDRAPLMILLLARIEREHGSWQVKVNAETNYAHRYTEISLKPLTLEDSNNLVDHLLEVANLPLSTRRLILEHSEGNPFYLEEILRSLIEQGALVHEGQTWRATAEIERVEIPPTLHGVLLARIDRLQEDVRRTLQLASVIGKSFLFRLLEAIAAAERQLNEHLSLLQRADLVREKNRRPELEYMFKHSLTQEAAYSSLLVERRQEFHHRVGEALEQLFAGRLPEFYGLLAHHFDAAGDQQKASDYLIKAGDKARMEDAHEEAIRFYLRLIELLDQAGDIERAIKTWLKLGLIYQVNFEFEKAHAANEAAFRLEKQLRLSHLQDHQEPLQPGQPHNLRTLMLRDYLTTCDPSKTSYTPEAWIVSHLFAGLVEFDAETNIVPHVARSWEVLDDGKRYVFHLRDDVRWTDGTPVTATDFEYAWKRNLAPEANSSNVDLLDVIAGARDYRLGFNPDPDSVGVRALDPLTLEVRLNKPVAYFIYLMAQPITFPLPLKPIEKYGEDWWKPEHIISNGAFRLAEFDDEHGLIQRNPDYFGEFSGNLDQYAWNLVDAVSTAVERYLQGQSDIVIGLLYSELTADVPASEISPSQMLSTAGIDLIPDTPPLNNVLVRRAIVHATDLEQWQRSIGLSSPLIPGGIVPQGMPGHSPELGLKFDLELAQELLAEAGYPNGENLPVLKYYVPKGMPLTLYEDFRRQWLVHLGLRVELEHLPANVHWDDFKGSQIQSMGWSADYPDPDNFLRQASFYRVLQNRGWRHLHLERLLEEAASTTDRTRRLAMYREADRILVNEEAVVVPIAYFYSIYQNLNKPWVKGINKNALGYFSLKEVVIEPH